MGHSADTLVSRRAVEALRAGVPNRDAVTALGFDAEAFLEVFDTRVTDMTAGLANDSQARGLLLAGEFGAGKSHALEFLTHRALHQNIAVSKVVISKETGLFDPAKVFRAAIEALQVPGRAGDALADIALTKLQARSPEFTEFAEWLGSSSLNSRFAATVWLYENGGIDPDVQNRLVTFWAGGPLAIGQLRRDLRALGQVAAFPLEKIAIKDLARQRFQFMARLLRTAGYAGWLVLLDEVELIGRYTVLQRGRAYAELARLLGLAYDEEIPGMLAVAGITPDFSVSVIRGKDDLNQIDFKFRARGDADSILTAGLAERAMDEIDQHLHRLPEPDQDRLARTLGRLTEVYASAYGAYPTVHTELTQVAGWQMREYIRGWITAWDLHRLDPTYQSEVEVDRLVTEYTEDELLESTEDRDVDATGDQGLAE